MSLSILATRSTRLQKSQANLPVINNNNKNKLHNCASCFTPATSNHYEQKCLLEETCPHLRQSACPKICRMKTGKAST